MTPASIGYVKYARSTSANVGNSVRRSCRSPMTISAPSPASRSVRSLRVRASTRTGWPCSRNRRTKYSPVLPWRPVAPVTRIGLSAMYLVSVSVEREQNLAAPLGGLGVLEGLAVVTQLISRLNRHRQRAIGHQTGEIGQRLDHFVSRRLRVPVAEPEAGEVNLFGEEGGRRRAGRRGCQRAIRHGGAAELQRADQIGGQGAAERIQDQPEVSAG